MTPSRSTIGLVLAASVLVAYTTVTFGVSGVVTTAAVLVVATFAILGYYVARRSHGPLFPMAFVAAAGIVLGLGTLANPAVDDGRSTWRTWFAVGLALAAFSCGAVLGLLLLQRMRGAVGSWSCSVGEGLTSRQRNALRIADGIAIACALLNLTTGEVAIFSADLTTARFTGNYGALGRAWPLLLGALEASLALHLVLFGRRRKREDLVVSLAVAMIFVATASRSFLFIAAAAIAITYLERRRPPLWLVTVVLGAGIVFAGSLGYLRATSELGAANVDRSLSQREFPSGPLGQTLSNLTTGPWVLSTTLESVPDDTPYQGGTFFLADGQNLVDSSVVRSDRWVTQTVMGRSVESNGGMPPTLVGGLYLDFGFLGIGVGMTLLGFATVWFYRWSAHRGLAGRLQYGLWCAYLLTGLYSYLSLKPAFVASILLLELVARSDPSTRRRPDTVVAATEPGARA